jgi:hypothetical protein
MVETRRTGVRLLANNRGTKPLPLSISSFTVTELGEGTIPFIQNPASLEFPKF